MKIALITDTHAGARNDSPAFDRHMEEFFTDFFFPTLEERGIKEIIHLGDIFDRRKYVNIQTLHSFWKYFLHPLEAGDYRMEAILGNHDTYFKNTNDVNSPSLLLRSYIEKGIITGFLQDQVVVKNIGGQRFVFVPWITPENEKFIVEFLEKFDSPETTICVGHFELDGFQMFQGIRNEGGMSRDILKKFKMVWSGHFHTRSSEGNVYYLGSPYEFVWSDCDDPRGFHIYDTETGELEFLENPKKMFHKIYYDDRQPLPLPERYAGTCVKVIVAYKEDYTKFEQYIDALYTQNVCELNIIEDLTDFMGGDVTDEKLNLEDTMTLLQNFVDATETDKDKNRIKTLLKTLYLEAQEMESAND